MNRSGSRHHLHISVAYRPLGRAAVTRQPLGEVTPIEQHDGIRRRRYRSTGGSHPDDRRGGAAPGVRRARRSGLGHDRTRQQGKHRRRQAGTEQHGHFAIACLVKSESTSRPLISACAASNSGQCPVSAQKVSFSRRIAPGLNPASLLVKSRSLASRPGWVSSSSEYNPWRSAQSALRQSASTASELKAARPIFLSLTGPTTTGPSPTASSLSLSSALATAST